MRLIPAGRHPQARRAGDECHAPGIQLTAGESGDATHRSEPQTFATRTGVRDPYALWLAEQPSERGQSEPIRWVYRYPRVTRPGAPAVVPGGADAASSGMLAESKAR